MENKYYTPEISEFHIGFEYEEKINFSPFRKEADVFVKRIFDNIKSNGTDELTCIDYDLGSGGYNVIVKYLDKEDIEALGWLDSKLTVMEMNCFSYNKKGIEYLLYCKFGYNSVEIYNSDSNHDENHGEIMFRGIIKNKSELNKLMKQTEII